MNNITKLAIVGTQVVSDEAEALSAAQDALQWHGSSEEDRDCLEVEVSPEWSKESGDESGRYEVRECWGSRANRSYGDGAIVAVYNTEAEADAHAAKHNAKAAQDIADSAEWVELPLPVTFAYLTNSRGSYPQSRRAEVSISFSAGHHGPAVAGHGTGNVRFVADSFSRVAAEEALNDAVDQLTALSHGYYAARREHDAFAEMDRAELVKLCRAAQASMNQAKA
jgi:hypothetical protein